MTTPYRSLNEQLRGPDADAAKARHVARLRELRAEVRRAASAGLVPAQYTRAEQLTAMLDRALQVLDGLAPNSQPLARRGLPGFHLHI